MRMVMGMRSYSNVQYDIKMVIREPVLMMFLILPFIMIGIFQIFQMYGMEFLYDATGIMFQEYYGYVLALIMVMVATLLGTVSGFMLIDERDARIHELVAITPVSYSGYLANRLSIPLGGGFGYSIIAYYILVIYEIPFTLLVYISLLIGVEGILVALALYRLASNKVQGLTYAKGMSIFTVLALADLFPIPWLHTVATLTPFYWIPRLLHRFDSVTLILSGGLHVTYLLLVILASQRKRI
ncbi:hypothetical protein BHU72_05640 [Desulfuribacillus stibiiarsenatis]|uniref:ABC-2 type transporter domain-containing protein n=1 Tax=Desulfuribacillus stibiiarsenatis TaxID=1390249 RepID=A0A1E5L4L6_9FIRM|nr:hypothetical protein [Desulfuribacillus stibiiarsenatis]OEH85092.1 hypothetical protein BHU72_05640 [Desulfuribacillus stibiiarsenatis]